MRPVAVHAGADGVSAITKVDALAGISKTSRQGDVLKDFGGYGGVSAYGIVGGAADEKLLPVGSYRFRALIAHFVGRVVHCQFGEDYRHHGSLG